MPIEALHALLTLHTASCSIWRFIVAPRLRHPAQNDSPREAASTRLLSRHHRPPHGAGPPQGRFRRQGDVWANNVISYENFGSNQWKETGKNFMYWFTEIDRTPNYVELARGDDSRKNPFVVVRLYEDRAWIKQSNQPTFSEVYRGSWTRHGEK